MSNRFCEFSFRGGRLLLGGRTYVMGIINATPDSFSDGGENLSPENALNTALLMERQGADILDIGGQSTRPGHTVISAEEEWARLQPVLKAVLRRSGLPISVDTFYPEVAEKALEMGCHLINDVSGKPTQQMADPIKKYGAGWVLTHNATPLCEDFVQEVAQGLTELLNTATAFGLPQSCLCIDPGIGFGKDEKQSLELIKRTAEIKPRGTAYLLGASRKRVISHALGRAESTLKEKDIATVIAHTVGIMGGADIVRVHNVAYSVPAVRTADALLKG